MLEADTILCASKSFAKKKSNDSTIRNKTLPSCTRTTQKESDRCGTRTHSLSLRRAARYHCANRPDLMTNYENVRRSSVYITRGRDVRRHFHLRS